MSNEIAVYDKFKKQLADFKAADAELSFDVETPEGYADCKDYHGKLREVRNRTDDLRLDTTKGLRGKVKAINNEGNEIIAEVDAIAAPYKAQLDAEDAKEQKLIDDLAEKNRLEAEAVESKRLADLEEREAKAQAIIDQAAKVDADLIAKQEADERAKQIEADKLKAVEEAKAQAEQDAKEALAKAEQEKQEAIAEEKAKAHQEMKDKIAADLKEKNDAKAESDRKAKEISDKYEKEQAEKEEADKIEADRVADVTHRTNIHLAIKESISDYTTNAANADFLIAAIVDGRIPHIEIVY